ncbi:hypothetical protein OVY01_14690 [Robbsia sp. Bb-Pol-6]|uniref:Uncharacterized protein n=1 Tax=Robbsia betulipollinis TaxID=2981849 RepID=A0ABT3ZPJ1_9BURK|nr:hypothetical protein [Robbsia betulipollinis]MCY0388450.1 hypothetical protein [Robbsia betulipollinis]
MAQKNKKTGWLKAIARDNVEIPVRSMGVSMQHEKIIDGLRSWMRVRTWDTLHPLDQERFHHALKNVFDECGPSVSNEEFEFAMRALTVEFKYKYQEEYLSERLGYYAQLAEKIGAYVFDNRNR